MQPKLIHEVRFTVESLDVDDLSPNELFDYQNASLARLKAHAPESHFAVGAVIRTNDEKQVVGWNVENMVYQVLHAEENAIGRMDPESRKSGLKSVFVVGGPEAVAESSKPVPPCGICRQKLIEFIKPGTDATVLMAGTRGKILRCGLKDLLPLSFDLGDFQK